MLPHGDEKLTNRYPASLLLGRIVPGCLFLLTCATTTWLAGWTFSVPIIVILLAHSLGHYLTARHFHVVSSFPYFVPSLSMTGTGGAFVKIQWPIPSRNALLAIFLSGPILGILASVVVLAVGLPLSEVGAKVDESIEIGEPLLMRLLTAVFFPSLEDGQDIILSPVGFAGWCGIMLNFWHLLPIGRFDGGRVVAALWGYRAAVISSIATILVILVASVSWPLWLGLAFSGGVSMLGLRRQYPESPYSEELNPLLKWLPLAFPILMVLTFEPEPFRF